MPSGIVTYFTLSPNEHLVNLTFRPSNKDIFFLLRHPKIEGIQLPKSYMATFSKSIKMFLQM